jgi:hypothetical protein
MKATIWLLAIWFVTLAVEVPVGTYIGCTAAAPEVFNPALCRNISMLVGAILLEATFLILMVLFIIYGRRGRPWSFTGAMVIGTLHAILSYGIYFSPGGPPLAIGAWLTVSPALVAFAGAASVIERRRGRRRSNAGMA